MSYRELERNMDDQIIRAILHMGAEEGVTNISSKRLAPACGISSGTIFYKYKTMRALLDAAAQYFDQPHMAQVVKMAEDNLTADQIWDRMLDYFLADPDGTLYYISYTNAFGFDPTTNNPRAKEFLPIAKVFFRSERTLTDDQYLIMWDYITSMAFYYAEKFIHDFLPYNEDTRAFVKQVVFSGITHILSRQDKS